MRTKCIKIRKVIKINKLKYFGKSKTNLAHKIEQLSSFTNHFVKR